MKYVARPYDHKPDACVHCAAMHFYEWYGEIRHYCYFADDDDFNADDIDDVWSIREDCPLVLLEIDEVREYQDRVD